MGVMEDVLPDRHHHRKHPLNVQPQTNVTIPTDAGNWFSEKRLKQTGGFPPSMSPPRSPDQRQSPGGGDFGRFSSGLSRRNAKTPHDIPKSGESVCRLYIIKHHSPVAITSPSRFRHSEPVSAASSQMESDVFNLVSGNVIAWPLLPASNVFRQVTAIPTVWTETRLSCYDSLQCIVHDKPG